MRFIVFCLLLGKFLFADTTTFSCKQFNTTSETLQKQTAQSEKFVLNSNSYFKPTSLTWYHSNGDVRAVFYTIQSKLDWENASYSLFKIESQNAYITASMTKQAPFTLIIKALNKKTKKIVQVYEQCFDIY